MSMKLRLDNYTKTQVATLALQASGAPKWSCDVIVDDSYQTSNEVFTVELEKARIPRIRTYGPAYADLDDIFRYAHCYYPETWKKLKPVAETTMFLYRCVIKQALNAVFLDNVEYQLETVFRNREKYCTLGKEDCFIKVCDGVELYTTVERLVDDGNPEFHARYDGLDRGRNEQEIGMNMEDYANTYAACLYYNKFLKEGSKDVQSTEEDGSAGSVSVGAGNIVDSGVATGVVKHAVERGDYETPCDDHSIVLPDETIYEKRFREDIKEVTTQCGAIEKCVAARAGNNIVLLHKDIYGKITVTIPPDTESMDTCELADIAHGGHYPIGKKYMDILLSELISNQQ